MAASTNVFLIAHLPVATLFPIMAGFGPSNNRDAGKRVTMLAATREGCGREGCGRVIALTLCDAFHRCAAADLV
jgi:hypothetical protein